MVGAELGLLHDGVGRLVQRVADQGPRAREEGPQRGFGRGAHAGRVQVGAVVAVVLQLVQQVLDLLGVNVVHPVLALEMGIVCVVFTTKSKKNQVLTSHLLRSPQILRLRHFEPPEQSHELLLDIPLSGRGVAQTWGWENCENYKTPQLSAPSPAPFSGHGMLELVCGPLQYS